MSEIETSERTLKATSPTIIPAAKKQNAMMSQMTPHTEYNFSVLDYTRKV